MKNESRVEHPPDGCVTNAWPRFFGPRRFITAEEFAAQSRRAMGWYDRLPREERDRVKERGE